MSTDAPMIRDPAERITSALVTALARRYEGGLPPITVPSDDYAARFTAVCDAVVQVLWPERYHTDPADEEWHTSTPARAIAGIMLAAAGITPELGHHHVPRPDPDDDWAERPENLRIDSPVDPF
jgi:hypothetical protein